jgi:hypothetical protein
MSLIVLTRTRCFYWAQFLRWRYLIGVDKKPQTERFLLSWTLCGLSGQVPLAQWLEWTAFLRQLVKTQFSRVMNLSRRTFTKEFKEAAVRRLEMGVSLAEVGRACEVNPNVLRCWRR